MTVALGRSILTRELFSYLWIFFLVTWFPTRAIKNCHHIICIFQLSVCLEWIVVWNTLPTAVIEVLEFVLLGPDCWATYTYLQQKKDVFHAQRILSLEHHRVLQTECLCPLLPLPEFLCWNPITQCDGVRRWGFGEWLGHKGRTPKISILGLVSL